MSVEILIMIITLGSASMSIIFLFSVIKENKVNEKTITKIFGIENIEKVKEAKTDEELANIVRSLKKKQKIKLKSLLESQDIRVAVDALKKYILKQNQYVDKKDEYNRG
jgi:hypothetical protein